MSKPIRSLIFAAALIASASPSMADSTAILAQIQNALANKPIAASSLIDTLSMMAQSSVSKTGDAMTGPLNIVATQSSSTQYFAGIQVPYAMGVSMSGLANNAALTSSGPVVGGSGVGSSAANATPLAGLMSYLVSNAGNASGANSLAHVYNYRAALLLGNTAYANAPDTYGFDDQMNDDVTANLQHSFIGGEIDMASARPGDCTTLGGPYYCTGLLITGAPANPNVNFSLSEAFLVEGSANNAFHYGYVTDGGVKDADAYFASQAATGLRIGGGNKSYGVQVLANAVVGGGSSFASPNFSVDGNTGTVSSAQHVVQGSGAAAGYTDATNSSIAFLASGFHPYGFKVNTGGATIAAFNSTGFNVGPAGDLSAATLTAGSLQIFNLASQTIDASGNVNAVNLTATGSVKFGTYTSGSATNTGYVSITDASGTTRHLAVVP